ncbi:hypothetical protein LIER_39479 [Lithospermum erythrorhizon]|uniref:Uncharacterized protein n=1 Tax=Lithospermum erythrorhizon TaxID=34254 RepID=A0AAV3QFF7_LITER
MNSHFNNFPDSYSGFRFNYGTPFLVPQQSSLNGMHGYASSFQECPYNLHFMNTRHASNCGNSSFNQGFMNNAFVSNVEQNSLNLDFENNAFKYPLSPHNHQTYVDINVGIQEGSSGRTSEKSSSSGSDTDNHLDRPSNGIDGLSVTGSKVLVNGVGVEGHFRSSRRTII